MKIFLVHKGRHFYLKYVIKELLKNNKAEDIIFLTDDKKATKDYLGFDILYENIDDYFTISEEFKDKYIHKSTNPFNYELFCFQRWLIILEYMQKKNIENCRHIDSDVLVFCNLKQYANQYLNNYDFCYVGSCGHTFYGSKKGLNEFKNFMFNIYKSKINLIESFQKKEWACEYCRNNGYNEKEQSGCFSDMTMIYLFVKEHIKSINYKDIGIIKNGSVYDNNINYGEGFMYGKYLKKLKLGEDNYYYGSLINKNELIKFNCIHFQGDAKNLISFYERRDLGIRYILSLFYTKSFVPIIINLSNKLGIKNILIKIYHKIKAFIFKQSMPLR